MFYFAPAEILQVRAPAAVLFEVLRDALRKKNVPRIAAVHDPLCDVDPAAGDVGAVIHIGDLIDRAAVNAHAKAKLWRLA